MFGPKAYFCTRSVGSHSKTLIITDTTCLAQPTNTGPTYPGTHPREGTRVAMRGDKGDSAGEGRGAAEERPAGRGRAAGAAGLPGLQA